MGEVEAIEKAAREIHRQIRERILADGDDEPEWEGLSEPSKQGFRACARAGFEAIRRRG